MLGIRKKIDVTTGHPNLAIMFHQQGLVESLTSIRGTQCLDPKIPKTTTPLKTAQPRKKKKRVWKWLELKSQPFTTCFTIQSCAKHCKTIFVAEMSMSHIMLSCFIIMCIHVSYQNGIKNDHILVHP